MGCYHYMILSHAKPGREDELKQWYVERHLVDVAQYPGVTSARLFAPALQKVYGLDVPQWCLMTIYELETEDPAATMEAIRALAGSAAMPMTDALDKTGMVQVIAQQIAAVG